MSSEQRKVIFTQQDEIDAARLLAGLDARTKKRKTLAGGDRLGPAQIQESQARVPAQSWEKVAEPARNANVRCTALDRLAPPVADAGGVYVGLEYGGHATTEASEPHRYEVIGGRACPNPDSTADVDRAKDTLRGFE